MLRSVSLECFVHHLSWNWWVLVPLIVYLSDYSDQMRVLIPVCERWSSVKESRLVDKLMGHIRHHFDLRRDHWEALGKNPTVEKCT